MTCMNCGEREERFVLEDRESFCAKCMLEEAKKSLVTEELGLDELDISDMMLRKKISREDAIKLLSKKKGG